MVGNQFIIGGDRMTSFTKTQILNFIQARIDNSNTGTGSTDCSGRGFFWMMLKVLVQNDIMTPTQINAVLTEKWG